MSDWLVISIVINNTIIINNNCDEYDMSSHDERVTNVLD